MLALIEKGCIIVPLSESVEVQKPEFRETSQVEIIVEVDASDEVEIRTTGVSADHEILNVLKANSHPGLVLFSSGSTGKCKAAVHNFVPMLEKYKVPRHSLRTITFLLFDRVARRCIFVLIHASGVG